MAYNAAPILVVLLVVGSLALGAGIDSIATQNSTTLTTVSVTTTSSAPASGNSSAPYVLTLVITTNNRFNSSVGDQPAYYIVGPNGLESAANITLPAHRTIELIIMNFDQGNATLSSAQFANVTGTQGGTVSVYGNNAVNSSEASSGILINGTQNVSSLSPSVISHTFTIPQLGINIPMASESTVVAYFTTGAAGSYIWLCETACGSGADGTSGAMETPGWMTGTLTVG